MRSALNDSRSQEPHKAVPASNVELSGCPSADELCDELTAHIFDCDACINGLEDTCAVFCSLRNQIAQAGGPARGALLIM